MKCKICKSEDRHLIERDMLMGMTFNELRKKYKISHPTLRKHKNKHIPEDLAKDMSDGMMTLQIPTIINPQDVPQLENIKDCINYIHIELLKIHEKAVMTRKPQLSMQALKYDMECIALALKAKELMMSYQSQDSWESILPKILEAVDPYPRAKLAIAAALDK